ncbi:MAG: Asp-tRNA(Asn)/Glu-tRNA(Gln) amidotransferase subunit GatB [Candidatus Saccharimonadales bacterium]
MATAEVIARYELTIGIECHVQLATRTKLFSAADNDARDKSPNDVVTPIDFGLPGMLPVLNRGAVDLAIRAGKALHADIARVSRFDRKHYFYPDLPKGYQTTQMYQPIIGAGYIDAPLDDGASVRVRIHHAHMEEDAGKLTHHGDYSLVDLNRAGTPLIEIVSEPDIHSAQEARAYAAELHKLMTYAGVTYGDLYHGNMRFDVNVSVAPNGASELGTRAEVKNLNSFRSVERAAEYEFHRQVELLEAGESVVQETRGWNDDKMITTSQRSKEDAQDYRYMPDADIPPIILTDDEIAAIQAEVPKLPPEYRTEFAPLGVDMSVITTVLSHQPLAEMVSQVVAKNVPAAKRVANWVASNFTLDDEATLATVAASDDLITLAAMTDAAEISSNAASELFNDLMSGMTDPRAIAESKHLLQVSDEAAIASIVDEVLADPASRASIDDINNGKDKAIGYLVGQVMKKSQGTANPALAQRLIRERL